MESQETETCMHSAQYTVFRAFKREAEIHLCNVYNIGRLADLKLENGSKQKQTNT